ncbi:MAG: endo-1,3-alpha-glucanase family glycosylhydrolase [Victivallales bacterium]
MSNSSARMVSLALLVAGCAFGISCARDLARPGNASPQPADAGNAKGKIVATHVMGCMAVGNGRVPKGESHLAVEPTRWNGIMAGHVPEYMANYGQPLAAAKQDISMMKAAGVNAIALMVSGHLIRSQFSAMNHAYFQAAMEDGEMKIYPDVWGDTSTPAGVALMADELALIKEKYESVWLRRDGRLVVSVQGLADKNTETADKLFAKIGGREKVYLILYGQGKAKNADAFTGWFHESYGVNLGNLGNAMAVGKESGKPFWQPVMPSFTQSRYPHPGITPNVREQLGMCWFRESWQAAIKGDAPAVFIETWNDLTEDSAVMPDSNHGYAYFELNKYYAAWFKNGKRPDIEKEQVLLFHHPQIVEGVKLPAGVKPMEGFPVAFGNTFDQRHGTPPTDYVGVVTMLKSPAKVSVMLGETVLGEREFPAGVSSWLLYQPRNQNDPRKLYPYDPEKVYPKEEEDLVITKLDKPFSDAEVFVSVSRGKDRIGFFRSHRPIVSAAGRGDMTTVGDAYSFGK